MIRNSIAFALVLICVLPSSLFAATMRIIHTNDLHSLMDHAEHDSRGGYAAVKATIDRARSEAKERGWETLTLDAGDFSEGSSFYLAQEGLSAYQMMNRFGFDASVIGNHDWLMGPAHLKKLLPAVGFNFQLLGANFLQSEARNSPLSFIGDYIKPYVFIERSGMRIAILGLTTDEFLYSWRARSDRSFAETRGQADPKAAKIEDPIAVAKKWVPFLSARADFVIALTHLGVKKDMQLVREVPGIDLVIGGHSHHCLYSPVWVSPESVPSQSTPIVQTGHHGENIGALEIEILPGKRPFLKGYRLIPVKRTQGEDVEMMDAVNRVRGDVIQKYGPDFFLEKVATAKVPLLPPTQESTVWGKHFSQAMLRAARADLSLDVPPFHGRGVFHPDVTMEDIFNLYPRVFDFSDSHGWNIWTSRIQGWVLELTLKYLPKLGLPTIMGGIEMKDEKILIQGAPLERFKFYKVAFGEGVVRASVAIHPWLQKILTEPFNTKIPVWLALRDYLKNDLGGVIDANTVRGAAVMQIGGIDLQSKPPYQRFSRPDPDTTCSVWR